MQKPGNLMNTQHVSTGFTLVEVLIAMLILTIGVVGFSALQGRNAMGNAQSQTISVATMIANGELEKLINSSYDACDDYNASIVMDNKTYTVICVVNENATVAYKEVSLSVSGDGISSSFSYIKTSNYE
jgi:type IV pilus assembly protein PilV